MHQRGIVGTTRRRRRSLTKPDPATPVGAENPIQGL
jgi:hypothetical protein